MNELQQPNPQYTAMIFENIEQKQNNKQLTNTTRTASSSL